MHVCVAAFSKHLYKQVYTLPYQLYTNQRNFNQKWNAAFFASIIIYTKYKYIFPTMVQKVTNKIEAETSTPSKRKNKN